MLSDPVAVEAAEPKSRDHAPSPTPASPSEYSQSLPNIDRLKQLLMKLQGRPSSGTTTAKT